MNDSKISVRYSRALFQSALEKKILDEVNQDMILIAEICKAPETKEFLSSPIIVPSKKIEIFHKIFGRPCGRDYPFAYRPGCKKWT